MAHVAPQVAGPRASQAAGAGSWHPRAYPGRGSRHKHGGTGEPVTVGTSRLPHIAPRREMVLMLMLGVAGAGLVLLAGRQGWAHVRTAAPRPLPGSDIPVTGQDLVPAAAALAVAALASLAAVLATRGLARRLVGLVLAGFGAGLAVAVS